MIYDPSLSGGANREDYRGDFETLEACPAIGFREWLFLLRTGARDRRNPVVESAAKPAQAGMRHEHDLPEPN